MPFYLNMAKKYANIRTFNAEDGTGAGNAGAGDDAAKAAADAEAAAAAEAEKVKAKAEADKAAEEAKKAEEAAKAAGKDESKTDAEKASLLKEVMDRKAKQREAEDRLKEFEGVDVKRYRELVAKEEEASRKDAEAKGDFERVKQMMVDAHATEIKTLQDKIAELQELTGSKDKVIDELSVGNAFGTSTYIADSLILSPAKTRVLYGAHFEVEDGKVVAYDKPRGSAERTMLVNGAGQPLRFDEALTKIIEADPDKNSVLRSKARNGAGSGTDDKGAEKKTTQKDDVRGLSRIAAVLPKR